MNAKAEVNAMVLNELDDFITELLTNAETNKRQGLTNTVDIDYVAYRLSDIWYHLFD